MRMFQASVSSRSLSENKQLNIFVVLVLLFNFLFLLITPPNQVPDENAHFLRSYEISKGHILPNRNPNLVPVAFEEIQELKPIYNFQERLDLLLKNTGNQEAKEYLTYSTYPILIYLPQGLGIAIGRLFRLPPGIIYILGRVFNALVYVGMLFVTLRIMPGKRWLFLMLFCSPMALYEAGSYSPDALTNALALFYISLVFSVSKIEVPFSRKQWIGLLISTWLLSQGKINIVPLAMLLLMVPWQRFGSIFKKLIFLVLCLAALMVTVAVWNHVSPIPTWAVKAGSLPTSQLLYVAMYPFTFLRTLISTLTGSWVFLVTTWLGNFGWLDTPMPEIVHLLYLLVLVFLAGSQEDDFQISVWKKWVTGLTWLVSFTITGILLYLVWTPYQASYVEGIQGRYLISFAPLLFLLIPAFWSQYPIIKQYQGLVAIISSSLVLLVATAVLVLRFYVICGPSFYGITACFLPVDDWKGNPVQLAPLVNSGQVVQEFTPECNQLFRVKLMADTLGRINNSFLEVSVVDVETQEVIKQATIDNRFLNENPSIFLQFDPVRDSRGRRYEIQITSDAVTDTAVTLLRTENDQYLPGLLRVNGEAQDGDLIFEYGCKVGFN